VRVFYRRKQKWGQKPFFYYKQQQHTLNLNYHARKSQFIGNLSRV